LAIGINMASPVVRDESRRAVFGNDGGTVEGIAAAEIVASD
jgi:hypothetical protein